jgi:hypothetical protein
MELLANIRNITSEQRSYLDIEFTIEDADLSGLTVVFLIQRDENTPDPLLIQDQSDMSINTDTAVVTLEPEETDYPRPVWYELWVDWGNGQWQKQFKGNLIFKPSGNYGN